MLVYEIVRVSVWIMLICDLFQPSLLLVNVDGVQRNLMLRAWPFQGPVWCPIDTIQFLISRAYRDPQSQRLRNQFVASFVRPMTKQFAVEMPTTIYCSSSLKSLHKNVTKVTRSWKIDFAAAKSDSMFMPYETVQLDVQFCSGRLCIKRSWQGDFSSIARWLRHPHAYIKSVSRTSISITFSHIKATLSMWMSQVILCSLLEPAPWTRRRCHLHKSNTFRTLTNISRDCDSCKKSSPSVCCGWMFCWYAYVCLCLALEQLAKRHEKLKSRNCGQCIWTFFQCGIMRSLIYDGENWQP